MALRIGDLTATTSINATDEIELSLTGSSGSRKITIANLFATLATAVAIAATLTVTSSSANALAVGRAGATNPALQVDASTASSATGLKVKAAAAGGGLALSVISSGTNENLTVDAKGSGTVTINGTGTGNIILGRATTVASGGVAVTGASTFSSTINSQTISATASFTGTVTVATGLTVSSGGASITGATTVAGGLTATSQIMATTSSGDQLKAAYDASNHMTISVASNGATTLNATGAGAAFLFSNLVTFMAGATIPSGQTLTLTTGSSVSGQPTWVSTQAMGISGNAATAAALETARTIGGVSFNGTANITVATATGGFTVSGGNLALGTNSLTLTGSIASTGSRVTKGWFTDLEVTNSIVASVTGSAATLTTTRTIWGQNFNGSANVSGALSGATTIDATSTVKVTNNSQAILDMTYTGSGALHATLSTFNDTAAWFDETNARYILQYTASTNTLSRPTGTMAVSALTASSTILLSNADMLKWGTTSSFPALKRSSTGLICRLADDSADAPFTCAGLTCSGSIDAGSGNVRGSTIGIAGTAASTFAGEIQLGAATQSTVGAAGGASALPLTPSGYLRFFYGSTEYVFPYYAKA